MIKYLLGVVILIKGFIAESQTFIKKVGDIVGNQTVISVPIAPGSPTRQALIYYPDDYFKTNKTYPVYFFLHGSEEAGTDTKLTNTSLPYLIKNGLKPYNIDPISKDTIKWIIISPQCSEAGGNCSYSYPQLRYTIPYCLQNYRIDKNCVWAGGLSMGGSATFSLGMSDTSFTMTYLTGLMPMANGGYDTYLASLGKNLAYSMQHGLSLLYIIGDQDPGFNPSGYSAYNNLLAANAMPGRYFTKVIVGGTHSANVWNLPFPITARVWSTTQNAWDQMWSLRKNAVLSTPVIIPPIDTVKKEVPYPVKIIMKMSDSSCSTIWQKQ